MSIIYGIILWLYIEYYIMVYMSIMSSIFWYNETLLLIKY